MTFMIHLQLCMVRILKVPPGYKKKKSKLKTPISFLSDTVKEKAVIKNVNSIQTTNRTMGQTQNLTKEQHGK